MTNTNQIKTDFTLDPATLYTIQKSQSDSLQKAICEAIMNSVDAKSTHVDIIATPNKIIISDNGNGFESLELIDKYFTTLGTAHEEGDSVFGRFRMGRAQLFCYGTNTWRSNTFEMTINTKDRGMVHDITWDLPQKNGCEITIDLYDSLSPSEIIILCKNLKKSLTYISIPVTFNTKNITTPPESRNWHKTTDEAWMSPNTSGTLTVYNMGVFVTSIPTSISGYSAIVVSKQAIPLNAARNDIETTSPIWKKILKDIDTLPVLIRENNDEKKYGWAKSEHLYKEWLAGRISTIKLLGMPNSNRSVRGGTLKAFLLQAAQNGVPIAFNRTKKVKNKQNNIFRDPSVIEWRKSRYLAQSDILYLISEEDPIVCKMWSSPRSMLNSLIERLKEESEKSQAAKTLLKTLSSIETKESLEEFEKGFESSIIEENKLDEENKKYISNANNLAEIISKETGEEKITVKGGTNGDYSRTYWIQGQYLVLNINCARFDRIYDNISTVLIAMSYVGTTDNKINPINDELAEKISSTILSPELIKNILMMKSREESENMKKTGRPNLIAMGLNILANI